MENLSGRVEEDGGLRAALEEVEDEEAPIRATRSGAAPAPESRKRAAGGSGTGKRKSKKSRRSVSPSLEIRNLEPEASETTSLAPNDHEASDVILDTIAMFESGRDFEDEGGLGGVLGHGEEEMPRIEEPELDAGPGSLASTPPSITHAQPAPTPTRPVVERTPEPSAEPEDTISPIIVAPPSPNFPSLAAEPNNHATSTSVLVEELKTAEEEREAREEPGFDETPSLQIIKEPSEEPRDEEDGLLKADEMPEFD